MELVIFLLIRSFHEANFSLYCEALSDLIPNFFANNISYAPWLLIQPKDMLTLDNRHPELAQEFRSGKFDAHKTSRNSSALALDQVQ